MISRPHSNAPRRRLPGCRLAPVKSQSTPSGNHASTGVRNGIEITMTTNQEITTPRPFDREKGADVRLRNLAPWSGRQAFEVTTEYVDSTEQERRFVNVRGATDHNPGIDDKGLDRCIDRECLSRWVAGAETFADEQPLPAFALGSAFAAPILELTEAPRYIAFEITGRSGSGKRTLLRAAQSAWREPPFERVNPGRPPYRIYGPVLTGSQFCGGDSLAGAQDDWSYCFNSFAQLRRIDDYLPCDELDIEDWEHFREGREDDCLCASLGVLEFERCGTDQANDLDELRPKSRGIARIPVEWKFGIWRTLPRGFTSPKQAAAAWRDITRVNHTGPINEFVACLAADYFRDSDQVRREINEDIRKFVELSNVDTSIDRALRLAESFGIVYSAAERARRYGLLPLGGLDQLILEVYRSALPWEGF
jgi:hypothetical protein